MVSEPNFVLGIKQTSLANKEDSHVHTSSEVTHACLLDIDSTASRSRHGSLLCPDPKPKQSVPLPIRSTQIQASPDEANTTDVLPCISRPKPRNPTSNGSCTRHHARTMAHRTLTRAATDCQHRGQISVTRAANKALSSTDLLGLKNWWSYDAARATTRHLGFRLLLHAPVSIARSFTRRHCC